MLRAVREVMGPRSTSHAFIFDGKDTLASLVKAEYPRGESGAAADRQSGVVDLLPR